MQKKIPFFEYPRLWNDDKEIYFSIIDRVASSGGFILQKELSDFENELANFTGANYSVGVGNATDAMEIFLEAIGLKKGDEIYYDKAAGFKIEIKKEEYKVIKEFDVVVVL